MAIVADMALVRARGELCADGLNPDGAIWSRRVDTLAILSSLNLSLFLAYSPRYVLWPAAQPAAAAAGRRSETAAAGQSTLCSILHRPLLKSAALPL